MQNQGFSLSTINPSTFKLYKKGHEVPLWYDGTGFSFSRDNRIYFVGERNTGENEHWAYRDHPEWQSSTSYSLYTDTTFYWLTWGGAQGLRYQHVDANPSGYADVFTFRDTLHIEGDQLYYDGDGNEAENPFYTRGEGYYYRQLNHSNTNPVTLDLAESLRNIDRSTPGGRPVEVEVQLNSITNTRHLVELQASTVVGGLQDFRSFDTVDWTGYAFQSLQAEIPVSDIPTPSNNRLTLRLISHNDFDATPNRTYVDWVDIAYDRELAVLNGALRFGFSTSDPRRIHLAGLPGNSPAYVFNPRDHRVFIRTPAQGTILFSDHASGPVTYWASAASAARTPAAFQVDRSSDWANTNNAADYVIITTTALRASAEALAEYRQTHNGFTTAIVDVQDVFDQFDYGRPTPLAIRRFVHHTQQWRTPPRFLVLWGDALYPDRSRERPAWEVPSFGKASSDGWFGMQAGGADDWTEALAIGRIPLRDNETGLLFIQKLQSYESQSLDEWQKRAMLMVGGGSASEQQLLQNIVLPWANRMANTPTGMDTLKFFSNTDSPFGIEGAFQDSIRAALREGSSWLTYFGHSSASVWDIVTDEPKNFNNATRLPMAISLGCRTGAFGGGTGAPNDGPALSEQLVLGSLNGSIGHWGSSGLGSISASAQMGDILHEVVFTDTLRALGSIFQEVKQRYIASGAFSLKELAQFGLLGDPATHLDLPTHPDFMLSEAQMHIAPLAPVAADSNLTVTVTLKNRGLMPADSVTVHLLHTAPDGSVTPHVLRTEPYRLAADVVFTVPITTAMVGQNSFQVHVDPDNEYTEVVETNNTAQRSHVVFSTELNVVAPLEMGTVASPHPHLRATFMSPEQIGLPVIFELDSLSTFDSPALQTYRTTPIGSYVVWQPAEPLESDRIYFWRVRIETEDGLVNWQHSSFFVDEDATGNAWIQTGAFFTESTNDFRLSFQDNRWSFTSYAIDVRINSTRVSASPFRGELSVEGVRYERGNIGLGMLILDGASGIVRAAESMATYVNDGRADPVKDRARLDSLVSTLQEGDYVYIRTFNIRNFEGPEIAEDIKAIFRSLGSTAIDTLTYDHMWIMRTRIGSPEETREWVDPPGTELKDISHEEVVYFPYGEGTTLSPPIGPAQAWETLTWQATLANSASAVHVDVLDAASGDVLLGGSNTPGPVDLSAIDAREHPRLRLRATLSDSTQRSTPQLNRWSVGFAVIPELALDAATFTVSADTLQEGETLEVSATVLNLSDVPADSVVLQLSLTDAQNQTSLAASDTLALLGPNETTRINFSLHTEHLLGLNTLHLEVIQPGLTERLTFNNTAITQFQVLGDQAPPVLEVTIDGLALPHDPNPITDLQDPSIPQIPVQPRIEVVFSDENPLKLLADTSLAVLSLDGARIPFASPDVQFEPATTERNEARIIYMPDFSGEDAVHTLRVEAFDVSGNEAEGSPYQTHFRVASTFEIGSIYPYPNPMSSFTRFAFLIKGSDPTVIDDLRIRIYTLTGRVVHEFDVVDNPFLLDGGQLRIGWNKLIWDGRDTDGDLLSPGVYLYKVFLRVDGEPVTVNNDSGIEKLVIVR